VHVHAPQTGAILLLMSLARRLSLANAVYTVQNSYGNYRRRNRLLMVANFVRYRRIVFCGEATRASMSRLLRWVARGKAYVVPNAVDLAGIDRVAAGAGQDGTRPLTVVWFGRLVPIKDPMVLLDAFDRARQGDGMRLVIVGDGALRPALESEIARRGLESDVCITGMVDRQAVYRHVAAADLFVSVSRGEGLPVAVLEAMACRIPVVLSDIPPHREVATGLDVIPLVPPGDAEGFATEIRRMAARGRDERSAIGAQCRHVVEDRYGLAGMHERYRSIYADARADGQADRSDGRAEGAVEDRR
jgi:glycosyltransferase involved in cell wall biosynthesis